MEAKLTVNGVPIPQGSKNAFRRGEKIVLVESGGNKHKNWRKLVAVAGQNLRSELGGEPFDGPLIVSLSFYLPKPASKPSWKVWCDVKPDLDKLTRSILDSLTGTDNIMSNDSRVVMINSLKQYAITREPGVDITVIEMGEDKTKTKDATLFTGPITGVSMEDALDYINKRDSDD